MTGPRGLIKITSASTERPKKKDSQNLAPVLVIISGNSLAFSRKIITSTGFYRCCAPGASAPVVVRYRAQPPGECGEALVLGDVAIAFPEEVMRRPHEEARLIGEVFKMLLDSLRWHPLSNHLSKFEWQCHCSIISQRQEHELETFD